MSEQFQFPPAVALGAWFNAALTGAVTVTDAANALETITDQIQPQVRNLHKDSATTTWLELVIQIAGSQSPVAIGLPIEGDPAGVPNSLLKEIHRDAGVLAFSRECLLVQKVDGTWELVNETNTVPHHNLSQTNRALLEQVAVSTKLLAASDLLGDATEVITALDQFRSLHMPPSLSKRSADALELAAKIKIIARGALLNTNAVHSPSVDRKRIEVLEELIAGCRNVLQSVVVD